MQRLWILALCVLAACADESTPVQAVQPDATTFNDVSVTPDVGASDDAPQLSQDARQIDTAIPAGSNAFGAVSSPCNTLADTALLDAPDFLINTFEFDGTPFDTAELSADATTLFEASNAGGSSKCSEVFSLELWQTCANATLHQSETQIEYKTEGSMTDYTVKIQDQIIGISVTRAYMGPNNQNYTQDDATTLLTKKLNAINDSTNNVAESSAWTKQILHIWTLNQDWGEVVQTSWAQLDNSLKANTTVLVTVESGSTFVVTDTCDD